MIEKRFSEKLKEVSPSNLIEQEHVLRELMQCYVLVSLARKGFFKKAAFQGGTCLRILFGLMRFSEDLDFVLKKPDPQFSWSNYAKFMETDLFKEGIKIEFLDKSKTDTAVKKAFLKTDSIGKLILLDLPYNRQSTKKIKIKLEIDIDPPAESTFETSFLSFPIMTAVTNQTLESSFASKSHALLCRKYIKGRDWYDFIWYVNKGIKPNLSLLKHAIFQQGPWAGESIDVSFFWLKENLGNVIRKLDWSATKEDVKRFIPTKEQESLNLWNVDFFLYHLEKLNQSVKADNP
ncbi:nucleotidyl transferase AbiEii/AbiGii toxin family protein [bacterium]|nr:nucleotidyl transferase AbiEii/AbiGii toxin family protein [bacterium]